MIYRFLDQYALQVSLTEKQLYRQWEAIALPAQPCAVLVYLIERRDRVVSRAELYEQLWPGLRIIARYWIRVFSGYAKR